MGPPAKGLPVRRDASKWRSSARRVFKTKPSSTVSLPFSNCPTHKRLTPTFSHLGHVKTANIAKAKNEFSRLIERVKQGETILITERDRPVACLQPLDASSPVLESLQASGLLSPPSGKLDLARFLAAPRPAVESSRSLLAAIVAEREETR